MVWEDWGSIQSWVMPKTQKMILDANLLNTQHYKVRIKGQSGTILGMELHPSLDLGVVALEKRACRSPSTYVVKLTYLFNMICWKESNQDIAYNFKKSYLSFKSRSEEGCWKNLIKFCANIYNMKIYNIFFHNFFITRNFLLKQVVWKIL